MEADLARFYRVHIGDAGSNRLTWRRMWSLISNLPPEAATRRAVDPDGTGWGAAEYLLAVIADGVLGGNWQRSGGRGKKPKQVWRPGQPVPVTRIRGKGMTPAEYERLKARPRVNGKELEVVS